MMRLVRQVFAYCTFGALLVGVGLAAVAWSILHLISREETT